MITLETSDRRQPRPTNGAQQVIPFGWPSGRPLVDTRTAKQRGQDQAMANAHRRWREKVRRVIREVAERQPRLTCDDIRDACKRQGIGDSPTTPNCWGAQMSWASADGVLRGTDERVQTRREKGRHREIKVWQSLIYEDRGDV